MVSLHHGIMVSRRIAGLLLTNESALPGSMLLEAMFEATEAGSWGHGSAQVRCGYLRSEGRLHSLSKTALLQNQKTT
jgi:hypothetical protein